MLNISVTKPMSQEEVDEYSKMQDEAQATKLIVELIDPELKNSMKNMHNGHVYISIGSHDEYPYTNDRIVDLIKEVYINSGWKDVIISFSHFGIDFQFFI